jgi:hypothetical protein
MMALALSKLTYLLPTIALAHAGAADMNTISGKDSVPTDSNTTLLCLITFIATAFLDATFLAGLTDFFVTFLLISYFINFVTILYNRTQTCKWVTIGTFKEETSKTSYLSPILWAISLGGSPFRNNFFHPNSVRVSLRHIKNDI